MERVCRGDYKKMKICSYLKEPRKFIYFMMRKNLFYFLSDKSYIKLKYYLIFNKKLNLNNLRTFNEKLQWLKLYDRKDMYTIMVDKYEVKKYVSDIIGREYIIPTIGIYDKFDDIDFDKLPNQFVMKCTHDSGGLIICKDKSRFNIDIAKKKINKFLKRKYYYIHREWPYKNVKPRILIEEYIEDNKFKELRDYKIYAFDGKADYLMLCFDRQIGKTKFVYFDRNWNMKRDFSVDGLNLPKSYKIDKPKNLEKMFKFSEKLSNGIPFVRVDFYEANGKLYFGELTLYPSAGFDDTRTKSIEEYLNISLNIKGVKE